VRGTFPSEVQRRFPVGGGVLEACGSEFKARNSKLEGWTRKSFVVSNHSIVSRSTCEGETWRLVLNEIVSQMSPKWLPERSLFIPPIGGPCFRRSSNQNCCRVASFYKPDFMLEFGTKSIMKCRPEWYHECLQNVFPGTTLRSPKPHNPKSQTCATNPKAQTLTQKPRTPNLKP